MLRQKSLMIVMDSTQLSNFTKDNQWFSGMDWQPSLFTKTVPDITCLADHLLGLTQINGGLLKMCQSTGDSVGQKEEKSNAEENNPLGQSIFEKKYF